jgi:hypothetical protein
MAKLETQFYDESLVEVDADEVVEFALDNGMNTIQFVLKYLAEGGTNKDIVFQQLKDMIDVSQDMVVEASRYGDE